MEKVSLTTKIRIKLTKIDECGDVQTVESEHHLADEEEEEASTWHSRTKA